MANQNCLGICRCTEENKAEGEEIDAFPEITICLDATLTRGGGLLIFHRSQKIYYYSLDWSRVIQFPDTSRIHLFNAAVALELFEEFLERYPRTKIGSGHEKLICETKYLINENTAPEGNRKAKEGGSSSGLNIQCKAFLAILEGKLKSEPFQGEWKYFESDDERLAQESGGVEDHLSIERKICKKLAEKDCSSIEIFQEIDKEGPVGQSWLNYSVENVSESVSAILAVVSVVLQFPQ